MLLVQIFGRMIIRFSCYADFGWLCEMQQFIRNWNANCVKESVVTKLVARTKPFGSG